LQLKRNSRNFKWYIQHYATIIAVIAIFLFFSLTDSSFYQIGNLLLLISNMVPMLLIALGLTLVFIVDEIDLSIGVIAVVAAGLVMKFLSIGIPIYLSIILSVICCACLGALNGLLVGYLHFPSTVTTLGTKILFGGFMWSLTRGGNIYNLPASALPFTNFAKGKVFGITNIIILIVIIYIILHVLLTYTKASYHLYAASDSKIALSLGLNPNKLKFFAYIFAAILASIAGNIVSSQLGSFFIGVSGGLYLLESIAAVFIGRTILKDGQPHILGTLIGILLIAIVKNGINIRGLSVVYQYIIIGALFIISLISEALFRKTSQE
jgi:ribose transport system permease protein